MSGAIRTPIHHHRQVRRRRVDPYEIPRTNVAVELEAERRMPNLEERNSTPLSPLPLDIPIPFPMPYDDIPPPFQSPFDNSLLWLQWQTTNPLGLSF